MAYNLTKTKWKYVGAVLLRYFVYIIGAPLSIIYFVLECALYYPVKLACVVWWLFDGQYPDLHFLDCAYIIDCITGKVDRLVFHSVDDLPTCWNCGYCVKMISTDNGEPYDCCMHPSRGFHIPEDDNEKRIMCFKNKTDENE